MQAIAKKLFGTLWEKYSPDIIFGEKLPGHYIVTIDGWYAGSFTAISREIAIKQFNAGLYRR